MEDIDRDALGKAALTDHEIRRPGKREVGVTRPMATSRDLSLAYSPGMAAACTGIHAGPFGAVRCAGKGSVVAVVPNGTAVLGPGDTGALASFATATA